MPTMRPATEFGQIVVNGIFTFALMVGLSVGDTTLGTLVANLGYDKVTMPKPVFIGDTLRVETEVMELREIELAPRCRHRHLPASRLNQRDEIVCQCLRTALLKRETGMRLRSLLFAPGRPARAVRQGARPPAPMP